MCATELWLTPPLHTSDQIRGLEERSRSYQSALHSCCFDTGGAPTCLSIIIVYSSPPPNPLHTHTHRCRHLSLGILPQLGGILQLWTVFHFFTGHMFDSLMAPAKRRERTKRHGASPLRIWVSQAGWKGIVWARLRQQHKLEEHVPCAEEEYANCLLGQMYLSQSTARHKDSAQGENNVVRRKKGKKHFTQCSMSLNSIPSSYSTQILNERQQLCSLSVQFSLAFHFDIITSVHRIFVALRTLCTLKVCSFSGLKAERTAPAEHTRIFQCDVKYFFLCVFLCVVRFEKGTEKLLHVKTCYLSVAKDKVMIYSCLAVALWGADLVRLNDEVSYCIYIVSDL